MIKPVNPSAAPIRFNINHLRGPFICFMILVSGCIPFMAMTQNKPLAGGSIESVKNHVKEVAQNTMTISCDFVQEKEMSMLSEKIVSNGKFYLKKEKMLRWEYTHPFSYLIVISSDRVSVKDENQVNHFNVQSNPVFMEINHVILGCLQGTILSDSENFRALFFENPSAWVVKLKPNAPRLKESLSEIVISFDRKDYSVSRLEMNEPGGDRTVITFTAKKINQPIPDEKFVVR